MNADVCFTCAKDAALAAKTHRASPGWKSFWVVESKDAGMPHPDDVEILVVDFDRGPNLRGWACIEGMVRTYETLVARGFTRIRKRDSDTSPEEGSDWSIPSGHLGVGIHQYGGSCSFDWVFFGCIYLITAEAVPILRVGVNKRDMPTDDPQEDIFFSWLLRERIKIHHWTAVLFTRSPAKAIVPRLGVNIGNFWSPARASTAPMVRNGRRYVG